ncbi:IS66 family transposase [Lentilactobacillus rapi]
MTGLFFHYATSRSEKVAQSLYAGYQGTLVCDGYNHLPLRSSGLAAGHM